MHMLDSLSHRMTQRLEIDCEERAPVSAECLKATLRSFIASGCLTNLAITFCDLHQVPPEIYELTSLRSLDLSNNRIESFSAGLTKLTGLVTLDASLNQLEGIPEILGLRSLQTAHLADNDMRTFPFEAFAQSPRLVVSLARNYVDMASVAVPLRDRVLGRCIGIGDQYVPQKIVDRLYLGGITAAWKDEELDRLGIRTVMAIGAYLIVDPVFYRCWTFSIEDTPEARLDLLLPDAISEIHRSMESGDSVLVHCAAGISRSPAVVIAYLMFRFGWSYDACLERVKEARFCVKPNAGFEKTLRSYDFQPLRNELSVS